jgi:hypothetical protein
MQIVQKPWHFYAARRASVEQLVTLKNEDKDVYLLHDDVRWNSFWIVWLREYTNAVLMWSKSPWFAFETTSQSVWGRKISLRRHWYFFSTVKPAVGVLWRLTDKCMCWMKSLCRVTMSWPRPLHRFFPNKMKQQFLLLGSRWTLQGLFFECRRISRFDDIYWPARLPDTSAYSLFFLWDYFKSEVFSPARQCPITSNR